EEVVVTPFQQFRLWARRAPVGERVSAALAASVALALLVWVLVPVTRHSNGALSVQAGAGGTGGAENGSTAPGGTGAGGTAGCVAGRKLRAQFYPENPADESDQQATCLDMASFAPFFVIDAGGYYGSTHVGCFPQHQLPFLSTNRLTVQQRDQFYPYMFSTGLLEELYR